MQKLLLNSIWMAVVILPILFANDRSPRRGVKKAISAVIGYCVFYVIFLHYFFSLVD